MRFHSLRVLTCCVAGVLTPIFAADEPAPPAVPATKEAPKEATKEAPKEGSETILAELGDIKIPIASVLQLEKDWIANNQAQEPGFTLSAEDRAEGWQRLTVRAQAFAQLGAGQEAVLAAQEALRLAPRNGQAAFEASLVFAMVGDRTMALANAHRARDLGFDAPAWFRLPWFAALRDDAGFRRLAGL